MWVYWLSEPRLWTVGYYDPDGTQHADSDHTSQDAAARRVAWLNGGRDARVNRLIKAVRDLRARLPE